MTITINGSRRESTGKNAARRVRREGKLPAILYGPHTESVPLTIEKKDIFAILKSETGENTLFKIALDKDVRDVMIKEIQQDVVSDELKHVDLIQVALDKAIRVMVSVELTGEAFGVKNEGGFVDFITRELEIECLPGNIPEAIEIDISGLHLNQSIKVEDAPRLEGVEYTDDSQTVIALIQSPTAEEAPKGMAAEEEAVIGEEEQPEVIGREKEESDRDTE